MNHRRRAENALRRVLAPHMHKADLFELLADEFERVLRQTELEGRQRGIAAAANLVGRDLMDRGAAPALNPLFKSVIALLKTPRARLGRVRRGKARQGRAG